MSCRERPEEFTTALVETLKREATAQTNVYSGSTLYYNLRRSLAGSGSRMISLSPTVMMRTRCPTHHRSCSRPRLHSFVHTRRHMPSSAYFDPARSSDLSVSSTPADLSSSQRRLLEAALRVDQAGEVAANYIYEGQLAILRRDPMTAALIQASLWHLHPTLWVSHDDLQDMWDQERKHLAVMNKLQIQHQVRPTMLWEVAKVAGFGLGAVTALMGKEAAMACTEAVETVIGEHYDE
jgi:3-demethoxyubiquinol 3-hydroxylase